MNTRLLVFHPQDLYNLFVHYTDGQLPLSGKVQTVGVSRILERIVVLGVESGEWKDDTNHPFVLTFEGNRVASFDEKGQPVRNVERNENPKRQ